MDGVKQMYAWSAQIKGMGRASGVDCYINITAKGNTPPKGLGASKDIGIFRTAMGDMGTIKGFDVAKIVDNKPMSVGLWTYMTMSDKLMWLKDVMAIVTFEGVDPMWQEFNIAIYKWI